MPAKPQQVLTEEHLKRINAMLRKLGDLVPECDRQEACGQDVADYRRMIDFLREGLSTVKQRYFPRRP